MTLMKPAVKNAVESALVAAAVSLVCLWLLIQSANAAEMDVTMTTLYAVCLGAAVLAHLFFMVQAVRRDGRAMWPWAIALVLFLPITSIVLLVLFYGIKPAVSESH